jgi:two-component system, OmpR family, response regulator
MTHMNEAASSEGRILVVDDEASITELVGMALRYEGFTVQAAQNGREALDAVPAFDPDLVVLDIMMPGLDGFEVARRLRNGSSGLPILFLTARDGTEDKVRGLTLGGDDYMTKPFSVEELVARIRAILRRVRPAAASPGRLSFSDLELDEDAHQVWRAGAEIELTATEFKLLRYLMLNVRRVLSKDQILDHVWNYDFGGNANIVETYISYLRRKIDGSGTPLIQTVRGVGYTIRLPRE